MTDKETRIKFIEKRLRKDSKRIISDESLRKAAEAIFTKTDSQVDESEPQSDA